jgi:hypothetical protein
MTWHLEVSRREHDCAIVTQIMRMRGGLNVSDIFQAKHVLLTRNALLAQSARKYCVDRDLMPSHSVSPAMHQRQLATAVWLRTGLGKGEDDVPRRYLLAACERVLELKKNVVDQVRIVARNLTPEKAEQLDLLLTQDRSVQVLMDKTLGLSNVVSSSNIEGLIDTMKQSLTSEIQEKANSEIEAAQREAAAKVRKARERRRLAELQAGELTGALNAIDAEDRNIVRQLLDEINGQIRKRKRIIKYGAALLILFIGSLPLLTESLTVGVKIASLLFAGLIAGVFAFFQVFDRPIGLDLRIEHWGRKLLQKTADQRGFRRKLEKYDVHYKNERFQVGTKVDASLLESFRSSDPIIGDQKKA